jgi:outer membrane lipoprotein-sorting protein
MRSRAFTTFLFLINLSAAPDGRKDTILARMDKAAIKFKNMTARVTNLVHTDVISDDSTETGTVVMQKVGAGEVRGLINFLTPDKRSVSFENRKLSLYYPKINTVQEFDLGKHGEQLDQFLMIGFGTSGTALAKDYDVSVLRTATVKGFEGIQTIRLLLIPKTAEARLYVRQVELWIPETGDPYPVQEKISAPSGDYRVITYTELKTNQPLPPGALQLKPARGFKTEYPGK